MTPRSLAFVLALCASGLTAAACGGRSSELSGIGGGGGSSGSSSGGGSSGGGSGGSSGGGSGSSSGGGSGSSSGGTYACPPSYPSGQCYEDGQYCSYSDDACGAGCECENGQWNCFTDPCPPPPPPICPTVAPVSGASCAGDDAQSCTYTNGTSCSDSVCTCDGSTWSCSTSICLPPPVCPTFPPASGDSCTVGESCVYYVNGDCNQETCECYQSGTWSCSYSEGCDYDAGTLPP